MTKKVFLGIGHGGKDPGAMANGLKEKDINLAIGLSCHAELARHGVQVLMSRTEDEDDPLSEEITEANSFKPDLAVDIHNNAGGGDGFEAYHQTNHYRPKSQALAKAIEAEVIKLGQNSRGVKARLNSYGLDYYGFVRQISAPAILIECAFIDSTDRTIIDEPHEQQAMGVAVAKGILATLGIEWQPLITASPEIDYKSMYYEMRKELQVLVDRYSSQ